MILLLAERAYMPKLSHYEVQRWGRKWSWETARTTPPQWLGQEMERHKRIFSGIKTRTIFMLPPHNIVNAWDPDMARYIGAELRHWIVEKQVTSELPFSGIAALGRRPGTVLFGFEHQLAGRYDVEGVPATTLPNLRDRNRFWKLDKAELQVHQWAQELARRTPTCIMGPKTRTGKTR